MTETRLIFIGNTDAVQKLLEMNVVTPLTVRPINLTSKRSLAHGSRTSVELDDVNLLVGGRDSIDSLSSGPFALGKSRSPDRTQA